MWCILLFAFLSSVLGKTEFQEENGVTVLTNNNFNTALDEHDFVMVEFYAPWCGHCKALKPEYERAAEVLKSVAPNVLVAKVDATVESELASAHGVSGYPTVKFYKHGKWIDYSGDRKTDAIVTWILRKIGPAIKVIDSLADLENLTKSNNVVVVGFIKESHNEAEKVLQDTAESLDDVIFAIARSSEILSHFSVSKDVQISLFKTFDEGRVDYDGELEQSKITEFIQKESIPLIVEFSEDSAGAVFSSPIRMHLVAFVPKSGTYEKSMEIMKPVANLFKGQVHFIIIDTDVEHNQRILEFFGMTKDDVPGYRLINLTDDMTKFQPDTSDFSESSISAFIKDVLNGTRKPFLMSEDIPAESNEPVRVLVGKNYNNVTKDESKAVFVKLYAPWCGHCQQLAPIWTSLGEAFKDNDDVIIAKFDATTNEAEGLRVHSFPTLKYYPKGSQEVIDYSGERTLDALKKFVESEGKVGGREAPEETQDTEEVEPKDEL